MALENEQELQQAMADLVRSMQGLGTDAANADNELTKFAKTTIGNNVQLVVCFIDKEIQKIAFSCR